MDIILVSAYRQLDAVERVFVDQAVTALEDAAAVGGYPIADSLGRPIALPMELRERGKVLLQRQTVTAAIAERVAAISAARDLTQDRIFREWIALATSNVQDFIEYDGDGNPCFDLRHAPPEAWKAVKSLEVKTNTNGYEAPTKVEIKVQLWDKVAALRAVSEMVGLLDPDGEMRQRATAAARAREMPEGTTIQEAGDAYAAMLGEV